MLRRVSTHALMLQNAPTALGTLSAMITPAVLLSACGTLILSTSNRLGRVVDRVRKLSVEIEELDDRLGEEDALEVKRAFVLRQLKPLMRRARMLQRGLTGLYLSVCLFVGTSVAIGLGSVLDIPDGNVAAVGLGVMGTCLLFYASVLLILEARLAYATLRIELDFLWTQGKLHASSDVLDELTEG